MPALLEASLPSDTSGARWPIPAVTALWIVLLAALFAHPLLTASSHLGEELTRNTVRLSVAYYAVTAVLMLCLRPVDWTARPRTVRLARRLWTLAWVAYAIHLAVAFHFYHGWSHANAMEHVRQRSGVGEGIYISHLFTLLWTMDVAWWQLAPQRYAARSAWVGWLLHGFMSFVVFNGTVVYETGPVQWGGAIYFTLASVLLIRRLVQRS